MSRESQSDIRKTLLLPHILNPKLIGGTLLQAPDRVDEKSTKDILRQLKTEKSIQRRHRRFIGLGSLGVASLMITSYWASYAYGTGLRNINSSSSDSPKIPSGPTSIFTPKPTNTPFAAPDCMCTQPPVQVPKTIK